MKYMVCYDLRNDDDNYDDLYEELERLDAEPILESQWMINIQNTDPNKLRRHFRKLIGGDGRLLIIPFSNSLINHCSSSCLITRLDELKIPNQNL